MAAMAHLMNDGDVSNAVNFMVDNGGTLGWGDGGSLQQIEQALKLGGETSNVF